MNILKEIIKYKEQVVKEQKDLCKMTVKEIKQSCASLPPVKSFSEILNNNTGIALIAEIKKASPSKGLIREIFNPVEIAKSYEKAGAKAISVLTDEKYFQGSIEYLQEVRKVVDLPVLRKDFIIDPFQIYQTRLMGADLILLIASALTEKKLKDFYQLSVDLGLEVLLEVHNQKELDLAHEIGATIIGINNRNLDTFEVSLDNTINLIKSNKRENSFYISESGIHSYLDVLQLQNAGVSGVLVGESLMVQENIEKAVHELLNNKNNKILISGINKENFNPFGATGEELVAIALYEAGLLNDSTKVNLFSAKELSLLFFKKREMYKKLSRTGNLLIKYGIITAEELTNALDYHKKNISERIGSILVELGFCTNDDIDKILQTQAQLRIDLEELDDLTQKIIVLKNKLKNVFDTKNL